MSFTSKKFLHKTLRLIHIVISMVLLILCFNLCVSVKGKEFSTFIPRFTECLLAVTRSVSCDSEISKKISETSPSRQTMLKQR